MPQELNYWLTTVQMPTSPAQSLPESADVAIIGAGFPGQFQRGGPAESIPIPHALREELYNFLQDRTAAGVSQDPDSYLFWRPQAADD